MKKFSIGLDLGTSSVKAVLFSKEDGVVAKESSEFEYAPSYLPDGSEYLGIDMEAFYGNICSVLKKLGEKLPENSKLCGLAMASASGNTVICDNDGKALVDGYSWLNRAMSEEIAEIFGSDFGADVRETVGWALAPSFPLGHLSHLRLHAPEILDSCAVVCMATEYVLHRLTGQWGIDVSTATPFYLADQKKRQWNEEYLSRLGIPKEKLPPLKGCGDLLGEINQKGAEDSGLPLGTKVFLGSFDHPTAARACNIERQGDLLISCGTSWVCFFPMENRSEIIKNQLLSDPFLTPAGPWGAMSSLARASERIKEIVDKYIGTGEDKFLLLDKYSAAALRGADGLSFDPMGDVPDLGSYSKENIARALMEGIAKALKARIGHLVKVERITMCGGPSVSPVWRAVLADVFGVPVEVTYGPHSGAVGAAMYALK